MNHCQAPKCSYPTTIATATDPVSGKSIRVCQKHAGLLAAMDSEMLERFRQTDDPRQNRPPMIRYDREPAEESGT